MTNRAYRAQETFGADPAITAEAFRAYKFDLAYSERSDFARMIAEAVTADPGSDADLRAAQALLQGLGPPHQCRQPGRGAGGADGQPKLRIRTAIPTCRRSTLCVTPSRLSRPISAASIRSGVRSTASAAASSICHRRRPGHLSRRLWRAADRRHADARRRATPSSCSSPGTRRAALFREHPPIRLGHARFAVAALCRPDAAVRGHEDQARTVHPEPARRPRRGGLPARQQVSDLLRCRRLIPHSDRRRAHAGLQRAVPAPRDWSACADAADPH